MKRWLNLRIVTWFCWKRSHLNSLGFDTFHPSYYKKLYNMYGIFSLPIINRFMHSNFLPYAEHSNERSFVENTNKMWVNRQHSFLLCSRLLRNVTRLKSKKLSMKFFLKRIRIEVSLIVCWVYSDLQSVSNVIEKFVWRRRKKRINRWNRPRFLYLHSAFSVVCYLKRIEWVVWCDTGKM